MLRVAVSVILLLSPAFAHGAAGGLSLAQLEAAVCTGTQLTRWSYDETGALLSTTDALGGVWTYLYDLNRNLVSKQDANLQLTTYAFDSLDRRTKERQHLDAHARVATRASVPTDTAAADLSLQTGTLTWSRTYDSASNVLTTTDAKGQVQTNVWGILNRLTSTDYSHLPGRALPSLDGIDYGFDENGNLLDATERKTTATGATVETTLRTFDALDRLKTELRYDGKLVSYDYDLKGNRTQVLDSSPVATDYTFDALDRLKTATLGGQATTYSYWPDSLPKGVVFPASNGIREGRCYDAAGRLTTLLTARGAITDLCTTAAVVVSRYDYGFDVNGNRTSQLEQRTNPATQALGTPEPTTYGFDDDDRLVGVRYPDTGALYRLDAVGNRTGERRALASNITALTVAAFAALLPANLTHDITSVFTRADWLSTQTDAKDASRNVALAYDLNGNTTSKTTAANTRTFSWDCRDTLVSVADNGVDLGRYDYDRNLQRVKRTAGAETVEYVLDDKYVLQEADGSQGSHPATRRYHYAAQPLAVSTSSVTSYLNVDALGSVADATSTTGVLSSARQYNAWGEYRNGTAPAPSEPKLGYTGHQFDVETGLVYARARYYDPALGIFLSRDSTEGSANDAPSLHRFAYVKGNPLRWIDFLGFAEGDTIEDSILKAKQGALATRFPNTRVLGVPEAEIEKTFTGLQEPLKTSLTQSEKAVVETRDGVVSLTKKFIFVASLGLAGGGVAAAETLAARVGLGRVGTAALTIGLDAAEGFLVGVGTSSTQQGVEIAVDARGDFSASEAAGTGLEYAGGNVAGQAVVRGGSAVLSRADPLASIVADTARVPAPFKTKDALIDALETGGTEHAANLAEGIKTGGVKLNVLGDELFEKAYALKGGSGSAQSVQGFTIEDQIYLRAERASVASTAAHEGGHVESFLSGRREDIVHEEIRAFGHQLDFQRATGETPLFRSSSELEAYVRKHYSK